MDTYEPQHPHLLGFGKKKKKKKTKQRRRGNTLVLGGEEYLKSLDMPKSVKQMIMGKSFPNGGYDVWLSSMKSKVQAEIDKIQSTKNNKWKACSSKCKANILKELVKEEMESTAFVLRCMGESILRPKTIDNIKLLKIGLTEEIISGKWEQDNQYFKLESWKQRSKGRLVMGFGPSASGKTFWAENLSEILYEALGFPKKMWLSIDGGKYREASVVYQQIVKAAHDHLGNQSGLTNLVKSGIKLPGTSGSIFSSSKVKTAVYEWLKKQEDKPNLYIPDTLGSSSTGWHKWRVLTDTKDTWVGLCIYMHLHGGDKCPFSNLYKCVGCEKKGKDRQASEGKQYSPFAYTSTYKRGMETAKKAKHWMIIHNTGEKGKTSTIQTNFGSRLNSKLIDAKLDTKYGFRLVDDIVKTQKEEKKAAKTRSRTSSKFCQPVQLRF